MTASPVDTTTDPYAVIAALRTERDAGLAREVALADELAAQVAEMATRAAELADRKTEFDERIEHRAATVDVLRVMSASPGDKQLVFDLIVRRAVELCNAQSGGLFEYDGERVYIGTIHGLFEHDGKLLHVQSLHGAEPNIAPAPLAAYLRQFPMPPKRGSISMRAILDCQVMHIRDMQQEADLLEDVQRLGHRSQVSVPLLRDARAIGVITIAAHEPGGFSESQIALLKTFAEQAVIAITSAETYRALQTRTSDLQETLEYQTATSDVLKVISRSTFDLQPVLDTVVETAARLCKADQVILNRREGDLFWLSAIFGFPPEYEAHYRSVGPAPFAEDLPSVAARSVREKVAVHIHDVAAVPGYPVSSVRLGKQRTSLGVPMLREGEVIGNIVLARQRVEPFTDRQIELVSTFADQAVIAIENTRLLTEQREALERQTATAEVLQVINASPGNLTPVFEAILEKAHNLCGAPLGSLVLRDGDRLRAVATRGYPHEYEALARQGFSSTGPFGLILSGEPFVQVPDTAARPAVPHESDPMLRAAVGIGGIRTALFVPLRKDTTVLGYISAQRQEVRLFTDKQIALLQNFAAQAVIAMENARLLTEQREALEQQTATAEVLQVINASPGDLAPVFDAMLEKALRLCDAAFGNLWTYDGEVGRLAATCGASPEYRAELMRAGPQKPEPGASLIRLVEGEPLVHIADIMAEGAHRSGPAVRRMLADRAGARTVLWVPMRKDGALLGFFTIYRTEVRPFTDKQIALLENFAAQAVIATENARLLTEQQEALERQTAMAEVLAVINAHPGELGPVFDMILEKAHRLCDIGMGALLTCEAGQRRAVATRGYSPEADAHARRLRPIPDNLATLAKSGAVLHHPDVTRADSPLSGDFGRTFIALTGARTYLVVPLSKEGTLLGTITAVRREVRPFTERQITLLRNFAEHAVIAMENARLLTEQQEALEQQTATAEVLQVINASPGNLAPVFDVMLEKAVRLCGSAFGSLATYDGEAFRVVAMRGVPPALTEFFRAPILPVPGMTLYRTVNGEDVVHVADLTDDEMYRSGNPVRRALADLGGARTQLLVALRKDEALLGAFNIFRQDVRPFSDRQISLLENFAAQAVIAMENARLITEQQEALEQQTATAEVLQVINASPGNLAPVFDIILEKAKRLCEADMGTFWTFDGERFYPIGVSRGSPMDPEVAEAQAGWRPSPNVSLGRIMAGENVVHIVDVTADSGYQSDPIALARTTTAGSRSVLTIALRKDDGLLGAITTARQTVRPYSGKQIALLQNFAAQAVIAMENARLITEQREALEQQTATAEVLQVINASPGDLAPVFDTMLENAIRLCGAALGSLYTYDGEHFHPVALHGVSPAFAELITKHPPTARPGSPPARILETKRPVHVPDVMAEEMYRSGAAPARALVDVAGVRALVNIPLVKDDKVLGFFAIYRQVAGRFSDKQIALLENFAAQAVIAMESARLLHELRDRTDELVQRQAELRVTFENMGDGVAMFDETPRLVAWNRKFQDILDLPDGVLAERLTFPDYIRYLAERGEYGAGADPEEHLRRLTAQADEYRAYERARPDGRVIEIRQNPVPGGGFVLIYADITERKRSEAVIRAARDAAEEASRTIEAAYRDLKTAQANLIQAEKMASLGQLTAGIAHEIKNPLNFVNNFSALSTELIDELRDVLAPEPLGETTRTEVDNLTALLKGNLQKVVQHGQRADGIVRSMLDHSRGSSGERRMVDLNALIDEALNLAYHGARAQDQSFNIILERDFGEGIAPIEVNPQDITRVFLNIFNNGIYAATRRACEGGGDAGFMPTLKVSTRDAGEAVEIRVRDNGTGIPADIRDKLFQPFFTTKPTGEGTGLGLSITYDIVTQQHGGNIAVDSEVADFSEFTVRLPRNPGAL